MLIKIKPALYFLLFFTFASAPAFAQQNPEKSVAIPAVAPDGERVAQLSVSNPLFAPYKNQWLVNLDATEQRYSLTTFFPSQSISGFTVPEGTSKTEWIDVRLGGDVRYGITDRISVGVSVLYFADSQVRNFSSGTLSSSSSPAARTGFYNPVLNLQARLLGTHSNDWYVDLVGVYSPGKLGSAANPQTTIQGGVLLGRNIGPFTGGIVGFAVWSPETTSGTISYRSTTAITGESVLQMRLQPFFINAVAGFIQYVDPTSFNANDQLNGKVRVFMTLEIGADITANSFFKVGYGWLLPVTTDYKVSGLTFQARDHGGPLANISFGLRF